MSKHDYSCEFQLVDAFDEDTVVTLSIDVKFDFIPGAGPTGPSYASGGEPGYGPEIDFGPQDLKVSLQKDDASWTKVELPEWLLGIICDKISSDHEERMIESVEEESERD